MLMLSACSSRTAPAPVVNLSSGNTTSKQKINKNKKYYRVKRGETLYSIAFRANLDFRDLAARNGISKPYTIYPEQLLLLRGQSKNSKSKRIYTAKVDKPTKKEHKSNKLLKKTLDNKKQPEYVRKEATQKVDQFKTKSTKKLVWNWPAKGQLIKRFSNKESGYKGIQIKNKSGTAILAATDGIVVYAGSALRGYGKLIIIKHNDDYLSAYAHNQRILVKEKQKVSAGQKIALMGNSESKVTGLRFEVRYQGKSVNPLKYLPR